jgi:hypothetical protein
LLNTAAENLLHSAAERLPVVDPPCRLIHLQKIYSTRMQHLYLLLHFCCSMCASCSTLLQQICSILLQQVCLTLLLQVCFVTGNPHSAAVVVVPSAQQVCPSLLLQVYYSLLLQLCFALLL